MRRSWRGASRSRPVGHMGATDGRIIADNHGHQRRLVQRSTARFVSLPLVTNHTYSFHTAEAALNTMCTQVGHVPGRGES
jgi:hypothetical protein